MAYMLHTPNSPEGIKRFDEGDRMRFASNERRAKDKAQTDAALARLRFIANEGDKDRTWRSGETALDRQHDITRGGTWDQNAGLQRDISGTFGQRSQAEHALAKLMDSGQTTRTGMEQEGANYRADREQEGANYRIGVEWDGRRDVAETGIKPAMGALDLERDRQTALLPAQVKQQEAAARAADLQNNLTQLEYADLKAKQEGDAERRAVIQRLRQNALAELGDLATITDSEAREALFYEQQAQAGQLADPNAETETQRAQRLAEMQTARDLMMSDDPASRAYGRRYFEQLTGNKPGSEGASAGGGTNAETYVSPVEQYAATKAAELVEDSFPERSFLEGAKNFGKGGAVNMATLGAGSMYAIPKQLEGLWDMGLSVTDALGFTDADTDDARRFVSDLQETTGGDPYQMGLNLKATIDKLGPRIREDWAAPIREAAEIFGVDLSADLPSVDLLGALEQ